MMNEAPSNYKSLLELWRSKWEDALGAWSNFTKLSEPRWCFTKKDEEREHITDSFAMIRLIDHAVVISLRQIKEKKLEKYAIEILAHEIGHHVFTPADLRDNARLIARIRGGLPTREKYAAFVANLYTDLLINDRLSRDVGLDLAGVYKTMNIESGDKLWNMYMRIYEDLWSLPRGTLAHGNIGDQMRNDAQLGARIIRVYSKDWLRGAGRFAALCLPYLLEIPEDKITFVYMPWMDAERAGEGDEIPDGMVDIDDEELDGAIHPSKDRNLTGLGADDSEEDLPDGSGRATIGGKKNNYRSPSEYTELMKSLGVKINERELIVRYYRERARPHIVKFPSREIPESTDPLPEGVETWDVGSPLADVDWNETLIKSPHVIPGVTTVERTYGTQPGGMPERNPVDCYIGIDCSGSMFNPAFTLSYPVLAGVIIAVSALRAGAKVMATLSGEPGKYSNTEGFVRGEKEILNILTGYHGTGYAFGISRLKQTFIDAPKSKRAAHILIVTDQDIFAMLSEVKSGWEIAAQSLKIAGGGGTFVLNMPAKYLKDKTDRLRGDGWNVHFVSTWEEMIEFARAFSKMKYEL